MYQGPSRCFPSRTDSIEYSQCDLEVVDSIFRVCSVEILPGGELWVWLPLSLDYPSTGGRIHRLTWELFGMSGLN